MSTKSFFSICQRPVEGRQYVAGESVPGPLLKAVEVKPGLWWRSHMVGIHDVRYLEKESGGCLHDGSAFEAAKLKEQSNLSPLIADIELSFFSAHFGLVLV